MNELSVFCNANAEWILPEGGFGDMLILSSVLKSVYDFYPERNLKLVRRSRYLPLFKNHPALKEIAFPPPNANLIRVNYGLWEPGPGPGNNRPYQLLARAFSLKTPLEEKFYIPNNNVDDSLLMNFIPWEKRNIVFAFFSKNPRKMMDIKKWQKIADYFAGKETLILTVCSNEEMNLNYSIKNTFSLFGLTKVHQLIQLLRQVDVLVTCDNFVLHAAHLAGVSTVAIWGPTLPEVFGYPEQVHIRGEVTCGDLGKCPDEKLHPTYSTECYLGNKKCINTIDVNEIINAVKRLLIV